MVSWLADPAYNVKERSQKAFRTEKCQARGVRFGTWHGDDTFIPCCILVTQE
jgi:hypothetical protein